MEEKGTQFKYGIKEIDICYGKNPN